MGKKTIKIDALRRKEEARLVAGMYEEDKRGSRNCTHIVLTTFGITTVEYSSLMKRLRKRYFRLRSLRFGKR